jgi:hypothetical protein
MFLIFQRIAMQRRLNLFFFVALQMSGEGKIDSKKLLVAGAAIAGAVGLAGVLYWLYVECS